MRNATFIISLLLLLMASSLTSCDRTPNGVISVNDMADLIADLHVAEAYMERHLDEFPNDSSKLVWKQSIFKKHGVTSQEYDSSLVWYAHNMEDYIKAHDKALGMLQERYDKLAKNKGKEGPSPAESDKTGGPVKDMAPGIGKKHHKIINNDATGDTTDLWQGQRQYMLTQGARQGFIAFDLQPDAHKKPGDRYQLSCKLTRANNDFKVSLNVDYTDGSTSQISRNTNIDGWVSVDMQSDTTRQVRRIYGYVGYDIRHGSVAYVDSLMLLRTHFDQNNYMYIHGQRLLERKK